MTGKSDLSEACKKYYKKLASGGLIGVGTYLLIEHLFNFGGYDIELIGHEYYGLAMIIAGFLLSIKWGQLKGLRKAIKERDIKGILDEGERKND